MKSNNRVNKKLKILKIPPIDLICPPKIFNDPNNQVLLEQYDQIIALEPILQPYQQKLQVTQQHMVHTQSNWSHKLSSDKCQKRFRSTQYRVSSSTKYKVKQIQQLNTKSPYLRNQKDIQKVLKLLKPTKGPTESLLNQIKKHNSQNQHKVQKNIMTKNDTFSNKLIRFASRMGLHENSKIFIMNSQDQHIRQALIAAGWVQNCNLQSTFFHLKWVYIDSNIDYLHLKLLEQQFYNHFKDNQELTNKNNLRKNIKKSSIEIRPNVPPTFDLGISEDMICFSEEYILFSACRVLTQLKEYIEDMYPLRWSFHPISHNNAYIYQGQNQVRINEHKKWLLLYQHNRKEISMGESYLYLFIGYLNNVLFVRRKIRLSMFQFRMQQWRKQKFTIFQYLTQFFKKAKRQIQIRNKLILSPFFINEILRIWILMRSEYEKSLGDNNIWIIKPAGVSRGSGITLQTDYTKILSSKHGKVVQKYIEAPKLLQCRRKFDIRQWVLVRSFHPLQSYIYQNCYCRFSSEQFTLSQLGNLNKHLTNFSKNRQTFIRKKQQSVISEKELSDQIGHHVWKKLKKQIKLQIYKTLLCCAPEITDRNSSFEIYGFDILIDNQLKPWVLEVNLSPACQRRSEFLKDYLQMMAEGIVDMIQGRKSSCWIPLDVQTTIINNNLHYSKKLTSIIIIQRWYRGLKRRYKHDI